jgi:hypothetical protein
METIEASGAQRLLLARIWYALKRCGGGTKVHG